MIKRIILALLLSASVAVGYDQFDFFTYFGTTAESYTVGWDPSEGAQGYQLRGYHHEKKVYFDLGETTGYELTMKLPKSGHYTLEVRAVNYTDEVASTWSKSTDPLVATVDNLPRAWWVYGYIEPPGPIEPMFMPF